MDEVIADAVGMVKVQAEQRGMDIEVDVEPGLAPLLAEEGLIRSAVRNLISNAVKFSHDGGRVQISLAEIDSHVALSVKDEGIGIPEAAISRLFTKFYRVQSAASGDMQGTGLGLALAKEAVTAHGGHIEVESTEGEGSQFTVMLPTLADSGD
jgi:signal transduction histidine kinase